MILYAKKSKGVWLNVDDIFPSRERTPNEDTRYVGSEAVYSVVGLFIPILHELVASTYLHTDNIHTEASYYSLAKERDKIGHLVDLDANPGFRLSQIPDRSSVPVNVSACFRSQTAESANQKTSNLFLSLRKHWNWTARNPLKSWTWFVKGSLNNASPPTVS